MLPGNPDTRRPDTLGLTLVELTLALALLGVAGAIFAGFTSARARLEQNLSERATAAEAARRAIERLASAPFGQVFALYNAQADDDPDGAGTAPGPRFKVDGLSPLETSVDGCVGTIVLPALLATTADAKETEEEKLWRKQREESQRKVQSRNAERLDRRRKLEKELHKALEDAQREEERRWLNALSPSQRKLAEAELKLARSAAEAAEKAASKAAKEAEQAEERAREALEAHRRRVPYWQLREDVDMPSLRMPRDLDGDGIVSSRDKGTGYIILPVEVRIEWQSRSGPATLVMHTVLADRIPGAAP